MVSLAAHNLDHVDPYSISLDSLVHEANLRQSEALRLYRSLPTQVAFHRSPAKIRVIRGGNRSGKSTSAAVEIASAATGIPVIGWDGYAAPFRYPTTRPMLIWVIGIGETHIGDTIHRLLFKPGAFRTIQDRYSGRLRTWNPYSDDDRSREADCQNSPPLIPERFVKRATWKTFGSNVFDQFELWNGTVIKAYSSGADVKMGDPVDLIWVDEDIHFPKYVPEWIARLSDRKGRFIWSAWPHTANYALFTLSKRAEELRHELTPSTVEFRLRFRENPFIDEEEKRLTIETWAAFGPEEVRSRDEGEYTLDTVLMYPNFGEIHLTPKHDPVFDDEIDKILRFTGGRPPLDWTRYVIIDPGHAYTAVLFVAVPPPTFGDYRIVYRELYLRMYDADQVAHQVRSMIAGEPIEAFIVDYRMTRQTASGIGKTYYQIYSEAFHRNGVTSRMTGAGFLFGSDNVEAGIAAVRDWLAVRRDGTTKLKVVRHATPNFQDEIKLYRKHVVRDETQDKPAQGQRDHLMDTLRYAAAHGCRFNHVRTPHILPLNSAYEQFQQFARDRQAGQQLPGGSFHFGAGTIAA